MSKITVFTDQEIGGCFEFRLPDGECRNYTLSYGDDGSVALSLPDGGPEENNNMLQIYPVLKNKSSFHPDRFKAKGGAGGGTLVGKDSEHESVSMSAKNPTKSSAKIPTKNSSDRSRKKPDSGFGDRDDDHHHCGFVFDSTTTDNMSFTWVRHAIISHYLGHCLKSIAIPVVQHIGDYAVTYSDAPDFRVHSEGITPTVFTRLGIPVIEVLSVVINNNKKNNQGCLSLCGTISMDDGLSDYIYNRKREDSESISFSRGGDTSLLLTGPSRHIHFSDSFWIEIDLVDKKEDTDDDDVFYKGKMYWNFRSAYVETHDDDEKGDFTTQTLYITPKNAINKPLATIFNGRSGGSVTINYILLMEGMMANVEVTLLNMNGGGDGAATAHVYGLIQAGSNCDGYTYWSVLLRKKKENHEYIGVRPGQLIPLSRSLVAANGCSSLKVSVELYGRLRDTDLSEDDEIVNGTVDFPAQFYGTSEENISGCYGEIQVKVTWD